MSGTSLMAKLIAFRWCILCECKRVSVFGTRKLIARILCALYMRNSENTLKIPQYSYVVSTYNLFSVRPKLIQIMTITTCYFK